MRNQVDYVICPKCNAMFAAMWYGLANRHYKIKCTECNHLYEAGQWDEFDVVPPLTPDEINEILRNAEVENRD